MAFAIPGVGDEKRLRAVSSDVLRGLIAEVVGLDIRTFIEGTVGNLLGISRGTFLSMIFLGFLLSLWTLIPDLPLFLFAWIVGTVPIWILPAAVAGAWKAWIWYIQSDFLSKRSPVLFEVKMPRDLVKSPRGMELALTHLWHDSGETTFFNRKWQGGLHPVWALEIASFGGDVHFYIWTWGDWLQTVQAAIYAQYPEVELVEVEDYASKFVFDPEKSAVFCTDYRYEPRNDAYPIKTYVEFELDKDPKEEYKVDPLAGIVEVLSNLKPNEQTWLQIIFTQSKDYRRAPGGRPWDLESRYAGLCREEIDKIRKDLVGNPDDPMEKWKSYSRVQMYRINEIIRLIERNMGKHPFNVGLRGVYIAPPEEFTLEGWKNVHFMWRPVGNPQYLNQLRPRRWHTPYDYPWQDLWDYRYNLHAARFFDCYRRRAHFYAPYTLPHNLMSTEVLATLWHPLSTSVAAPGVERVPAKKAQPPPNLPK